MSLIHRYRHIDIHLFIHIKKLDFSDSFRLFFEVDPSTYLVSCALMASSDISLCTGNHELKKALKLKKQNKTPQSILSNLFSYCQKTAATSFLLLLSIFN